MRSRAVAGCLALALVSCGTGCLSEGAFACEGESDCLDAGVAGRCEPTGFCSFPDASCESEHRYGAHAGDGLGGTCVPQGDGTTSTGPDDPSTTSPTSATDPTLTTMPATTGGDETPLTDGPDGSSAASLEGESSVGATTNETTTGMSDDESSTSGGATCPSFVDEFDDGVVSPVWTLMDAAYVGEADGALTLELTPEVDQVFPGVVQSDLDLASGWVRMRIGEPPSTDYERLYLAVAMDADFAEVVYVILEGGTLFARHEIAGMFTDLGSVPFDPMENAWIQIRGQGDDVVFEASPDESSFVQIAEVPAPFALLGTTIVIAATNFGELAMASVVSVEAVEICEGA